MAKNTFNKSTITKASNMKHVITEKYIKDLGNCIEKSMPGYFQYVSDGVLMIHNAVIDSFYMDYKPKRYKRTFSMYDIVDVKISSDGFSLSISSDESKMSTFSDGTPNVASSNFSLSKGRNSFNPRKGSNNGDGRGLFHLVYEMGYHGGALVTEDNLENAPESYIGTYRYRSGGHFESWGRKAERSYFSPRAQYVINARQFIENSYSVFGDMVKKEMVSLGYKLG